MSTHVQKSPLIFWLNSITDVTISAMPSLATRPNSPQSCSQSGPAVSIHLRKFTPALLLKSLSALRMSPVPVPTALTTSPNFVRVSSLLIHSVSFGPRIPTAAVSKMSTSASTPMITSFHLPNSVVVALPLIHETSAPAST